MPYLGCHLSASAGYLHMGQEALSIGADTFAYFTRNPRGGSVRPMDEADAAALAALMKANRFGALVAHAPYTLNLCAAKDGLRDFAKDVIRDDMARLRSLPGTLYNLHPGSHVGQGADAGVRLIAQAINEALPPQEDNLLLLETMSGKGSEVGGRFEELRDILALLDRPQDVGVCLDTCHVYSAGYDIVNDLDGVLAEFDRVIGLEKLRAMHINDSMTPFGSLKDRHAKLGEGSLGEDFFARLVLNPKLAALPLILETPNDVDGYAREIARLRAVMG